MQETIKYWKGYEELEQHPEFVQHAHNEFPEFLPLAEKNEDGGTSRRDFLKLMGFGLGAATLASCEAPVRKAIPWLNKPETVDPTISNFYASTYFTGNEYVAVLVKNRDGRPIKVEGNPMSPVTKGGTSARAQASILSLYDEGRARGPMQGGKAADWKTVDAAIRQQLAAAGGKTVALVTGTIISPTTKKAIAEFAARYPSFRHVMYDANSASALLKANGGVVPGYDFSKADVVVSIGADFLGAWISPVEYSWHWAQKRKLKRENPEMSRLFQFEPLLSLTGANADVRAAVKPSQLPAVAAALYGAVVGGGGGASINKTADSAIARAAEELKGARGRALVVCGTNDLASQTLVADLNRALGAEGATIGAPSYVRQGDDAAMLALIQQMNAGQVGAVLVAGCNPAYDHPQAAEFKAGLGQVGLKVSFADRLDETAKLCDFLTPDAHYLESWNDFEPRRGSLSLSQPVITPLFDTRQFPESLLHWAGNNTSYYDYLRTAWAGINWDQAVHDGVVEGGAGLLTVTAQTNPMSAAAALSAAGQGAGSGTELVIYESVQIGFGGIEANNPWLQELPDPISKNTWENYLAVPRALAKTVGVEQGDYVSVTANGKSITLPVLLQPGMEANTVAVAMGYGRTAAGKVGDNAGANAYPLVSVSDGGLIFGATGVKIAKADKKRTELAQTQTHHTIMDRLVVQESTLSKYRENRNEVTEYEKLATADGPQPPSRVSLWQDYAYNNHHWGMVIDLNSCIGCSACTVACQAENNVAVVGRQEVVNRREMSWLRIDRYYTAVDHEAKDYTTMEDAADQPQVVFQPLMCQHCNHAPCETVCPVLATTHSTEGLNQMTYNRCVGTKYCANNCPYKVRRFNWFSYTDDDRFATANAHMRSDLGRMVLNPDVTVRARGVMEKCSMCVQRIQLGKLDAKKEKRRPKDGEIVTACAQACPTEAILFGDMADPESRITKVLNEQHRERAFHVLEELNVQPNITYLTKIRNGEVMDSIIKKDAGKKQPA